MQVFWEFECWVSVVRLYEDWGAFDMMDLRTVWFNNFMIWDDLTIGTGAGLAGGVGVELGSWEWGYDCSESGMEQYDSGIHYMIGKYELKSM